MRHLALMETCRRRLAANGPAGAQGNIAGRRADKGSAGDSANGTATNSANGTAINSENSTARNSASETAHYRANGAAHRADKGKARGPANGTARDSERGTADGSGNSRQDATADNAPKGYLVCPTCGNIYPAECSDSYCPCCLTDGGDSSRSKSDAPPKPDFHTLFASRATESAREDSQRASHPNRPIWIRGLVLPWKSLPQVIKAPRRRTSGAK